MPINNVDNTSIASAPAQTPRPAVLSREHVAGLNDPPAGYDALPDNLRIALAVAVDRASTGYRSVPPFWAYFVAAGTDAFDTKALLAAPKGFNPTNGQWRAIQVAVRHAYEESQQTPPPWTRLIG
jgi:hypothetical protein